MANELMVVYVTNNDVEARIVAGRLESEGIPALVQQEPAGSALGITVGLLGEVRVAVRAEDYDAALEVLDTDPNDPALPDELDDILYDDDPDQ